MWFPLHESKEKDREGKTCTSSILSFPEAVWERGTQTSVQASQEIRPSIMGQRLSSLSNFSCMFHLVPCYSFLILFFNIFVVLVCVTFPLWSRFPPGICAVLSLINCQLISVRGNSGTVLQFGAQLSPEEPLFAFILPYISWENGVLPGSLWEALPKLSGLLPLL